MKWISVDDGLPEANAGLFPDESDSVLVYAYGVVFCACYNHSEKYWRDSETEKIEVSHWMPLPEPPTKN